MCTRTVNISFSNVLLHLQTLRLHQVCCLIYIVVTNQNYVISSNKCNGNLDKASKAYELFNSTFIDFDPSDFFTACQISCIRNVTFSTASTKYTTTISLNFSPGSDIPSDCVCGKNLTFSLPMDISQHVGVNVSVTNFGTISISRRIRSTGYDPNLILRENFGSVTCELALDYVLPDGSIFNPYPSINLVGERTFNRSYVSCVGDFSNFDTSFMESVAASYGVASLGDNGIGCIQACTKSATILSFDSKSHSLEIEFHPSVALPQGCTCSSASVVLTQYTDLFYRELPLGSYDFKFLNQNDFSLGLYASSDSNGALTCYSVYTNETITQIYPDDNDTLTDNFVASKNYIISSAKCVGSFDPTSSAYALFNDYFEDFKPSNFPNECNIACIKNVTFSSVSKAISKYYSDITSFELKFSPASDVPEGCSCQSNLTLSVNDLPPGSSQNLFGPYDSANITVPDLGLLATSPLSKQFQYPNRILHQYFESVKCEFTLDYVQQDGIVFDSYPNINLSGENMFRRVYGYCSGNWSVFNSTSIESSYGMTFFGEIGFDCVQACTDSATLLSYDSQAHSLEIEFHPNATLPLECICSSAPVIYQQVANKFYKVIPDAANELGIDHNSFYLNFYTYHGANSFVYCSSYFSNVTQATELNQTITDQSRIVSFNVSSASCIGDFSQLNKTALTKLKGIFPNFNAYLFPDACSLACIHNASITSVSVKEMQLLFSSDSSLPKDCQCGSGFEIDLYSDRNSSIYGVIPGLGYANVTAAASQILIDLYFGDSNCTLALDAAQIAQGSWQNTGVNGSSTDGHGNHSNDTIPIENKNNSIDTSSNSTVQGFNGTVFNDNKSNVTIDLHGNNTNTSLNINSITFF